MGGDKSDGDRALVGALAGSSIEFTMSKGSAFTITSWLDGGCISCCPVRFKAISFAISMTVVRYCRSESLMREMAIALSTWVAPRAENEFAKVVKVVEALSHVDAS